MSGTDNENGTTLYASKKELIVCSYVKDLQADLPWGGGEVVTVTLIYYKIYLDHSMSHTSMLYDMCICLYMPSLHRFSKTLN